MWLFIPLLFSLVLSSWIQSLTGYNKDGSLAATANHESLAHNPLPSVKTTSVSACDDDWVCEPKCIFGDPVREIFSPIIVSNEPRADAVSTKVHTSSSLIRQPWSERIPGLDSPAPGGLDAWAQHVFNSPYAKLNIDFSDDDYLSAAMYLPWEGKAFFATVSGFTGCTSVIVACDCGIYIAS